MTATEHLRKLLNERGVKWHDDSDENVLHTTWDDMNCRFNEFPDGWTAWGMGKHGTPEEAVEATLGRGTCHIETEESDFITSMNIQREHTCGYCGTAFSLWYYTEDGDECDETPRFCPRCGREVVDE